MPRSVKCQELTFYLLSLSTVRSSPCFYNVLLMFADSFHCAVNKSRRHPHAATTNPVSLGNLFFFHRKDCLDNIRGKFFIGMFALM